MATNLQVQNNISSTAQYVQDTVPNTSSLAISSDKIGVGITTPLSEKLEVNGNIKLTAPGTNRVWTTQKVFNVLDYGAMPLNTRINAFGTAGTISGTTLTVTGGLFTNAQVNDTLWIHTGVNIGYYQITNKIDVNNVQVSSFPGGNQTNVNWKVTAGTPASVENTTAFNNALGAALAAGGGIVYVPTGYYFFTGHLTIEENVILQGMWSGPPVWNLDYWENGTNQGPVLLPTEGKDHPDDGTPFITLEGASGSSIIEGLSIFYPIQRIKAGSGTASVTVEQYPFCIKMGSSKLCDNRAMNLCLVNPYKGISMESSDDSGRNYVYNVHGMPLYRGIVVDEIFDGGFIEKIHFNPYIYMWLSTRIIRDGTEWMDWKTFVGKNLWALHIKEAVAFNINDVLVFLANRGLVLDKGAQSTGDCYAHVMGHNFYLDACDCGIEVKTGQAELTTVNVTSISSTGIVNQPDVVFPTKAAVLATNGGLLGLLTISHGVFFVDGPTGSAKVVDWELSSNISRLSLNDIIFMDNGTAAIGTGVYATAGRVQISGCTFRHLFNGFTQCFNISGEVGILYGNDCQNNNPGNNTATDKGFNIGIIGVNYGGSNNYQFGYGYAKTDTSLRRAGTLAQSKEASPLYPFSLYVAVQGAAADANRVAFLQTGNEGLNNLGNLALQAYGGNVGIGETNPATKLQLSESKTITGAVTDGYSSGLTLHPAYSASSAQTVTRHNYIDVNNPGVTNVTITNAAVMRFDAAAGTHKAVDSGTTKASPGTVNAWLKVNINGTIYYIPAYTSKTA